MTRDEALDLALEALGKARSRIVEAGGSGWKLEAQRCVNAITAIKQALAAPVKEPSNYNEFVETACALIKAADDAAADWDYMLDSDDCIAVLRGTWKAPLANDMPKQPTPPAQPAPVQEPDLIARLKHPEDHYEFTDPKKANAVLMFLCQEAADALASPAQEPVAVVSGYYGGQCVVLPINPARLFNSGTAFYITPPAAQRQWVGLTQEDIDIAFDDTQEGGGFNEFAYAIEQRLKEKNT